MNEWLVVYGNPVNYKVIETFSSSLDADKFAKERNSRTFSLDTGSFYFVFHSNELDEKV